jgi:hypothetical protein
MLNQQTQSSTGLYEFRRSDCCFIQSSRKQRDEKSHGEGKIMRCWEGFCRALPRVTLTLLSSRGAPCIRHHSGCPQQRKHNSKNRALSAFHNWNSGTCTTSFAGSCFLCFTISSKPRLRHPTPTVLLGCGFRCFRLSGECNCSA